MLRVRPIHFTSRLDQWERLLTDLGVAKTVAGPTWREFDAGAGRLALHVAEPGSAEDGTTSFGVEAGDLAEFARRTNDAGAGTAGGGGTAAEVIAADHGSTCRVTSPDGFSFLADAAARASDGSWATAADADPDLAVVGVWFAADIAAAARTLRDIGARPRPAGAPGDGDGAGDAVAEAFTAKNGGVLMVGPADGNVAGGAAAVAGGAGLGFEYAGDLAALRGRLADAGQDVALLGDAAVPLLHVGSPDADTGRPHSLWIAAAPAVGLPRTR